jgi:DNA-nicking Smr family endonuclease
VADEPIDDPMEMDSTPIETIPIETIPIEDTLDLHPFRPKDVRDVAEEYLIAARERGFSQVRLIHGRGIGVQREIIRSLLASLDFVEAFHDADHTGGGWGATVVLLRRSERDAE